MARNVFDREMQRLHRDLADMAGRVDRVMNGTIQALRMQDVALARSLMVEDQEINDAEHRIEQLCLNLIALQQPLARDLRHIVAALKIITDMERIADQCVDICEIMTTVSFSEMRPPATIIRMVEKGARDVFRGHRRLYPGDVGGPRAASSSTTTWSTTCSPGVVLEMCNVLAESPASIIPQAADYMFYRQVHRTDRGPRHHVAEWGDLPRTARPQQSGPDGGPFHRKK
jgi:phosphate transport system protein